MATPRSRSHDRDYRVPIASEEGFAVRLPSSHYLIGGLAHAAAATILLGILLLGALRLEAGDEAARAAKDCGRVDVGMFSRLLGVCGEPDQ